MMSAGDTSGLGGRGGLDTLDGSESTTLPLQVFLNSPTHPHFPHMSLPVSPICSKLILSFSFLWSAAARDAPCGAPPREGARLLPPARRARPLAEGGARGHAEGGAGALGRRRRRRRGRRDRGGLAEVFTRDELSRARAWLGAAIGESAGRGGGGGGEATVRTYNHH